MRFTQPWLPQHAYNAMTELRGEIHKQKANKARVRSFEDSTMVVCKCRKASATQLYCCLHNVPVCGECICHPEHETCVSYITMLDKKFDALSLLASEPSPVLSCSSVAFGLGIPGTVFSPQTTISSSSAPLTELCKDQTTQKLMQQNCITSGSSLETEIEEGNSIPSAMIDIEASNPSSPEIISMQTVGSPKLTKVLSRKYSSKGDKRTTDCPQEKCGRGTKHTSKGSETEQGGFLPSCSSPTKYILPVTSPSHKTLSKLRCVQDAVDGRWRRYCRATSLDPRKILFFCATLSSMGTMILIYLTLTVTKIGEGLVHMDVQ